MKKSELKEYVVEALGSLGGMASVTEIAKSIWQSHESQLRGAGDMFYTWQYDMRWAAQALQNEGRLSKKEENRKWRLVE